MSSSQSLLLVLSAMVVASSSACTRATVVNGPDGTPHQLIKCPGGQESCLKKATELCPNGYDLVTRGMTVSGDRTWVSSSTELLVKCKVDPREDGSDSSAPKFATGKVPEGALGYRFRINLTAAEKRCESQGFASGPQPTGIRCSGLPKALTLAGFVDLKFCEDDLCEINAVSPVASDQATAALSNLRSKLEEQYGHPTRSKRISPPVCGGERMSACVADGRAVLMDEWTWENGPQIVLSLSENQSALALRISYRATALPVKEIKNVEGL